MKQFVNGVVNDADVAVTDMIATPRPASIEQISSDKWDAIVAVHDDGTGLARTAMEAKAMTTLGLIFDPSTLTLAQVKTYWKNKLAKDCDASMYARYSLIQALYYLNVATGAGNTAAKTVVTNYANALNTAWTAVIAATTKDQVMTVVFVPPT